MKQTSKEFIALFHERYDLLHITHHKAGRHSGLLAIIPKEEHVQSSEPDTQIPEH